MTRINSNVTSHSALKTACVLALLPVLPAATILSAPVLHPLTIEIVESSGNIYFEPAGRRTLDRTQPSGLFIRVRNTSAYPVQAGLHPEMAYTLELKDGSAEEAGHQ